jgi:hypothetical protein
MRTKIRQFQIIALCFMAFLAVSSCSKEHKGIKQASLNQPTEIGWVQAGSVTTVATIESIDRAKRIVTIRSADGRQGSYRLGKGVRNFNKIKVGDQVKATLIESVAVFVGPSDIMPRAGAAQTVAVAPKGRKPAMIIANIAEVVAKIDAIDKANRTVTLIGVTDVPIIVPVGPNVNLANIAVGGNVIVRYTEATVIAVEKP